MVVFQSLTKAELAELLLPLSRVSRSEAADPVKADKKRHSQARYRAQQIFHWVYQRYVLNWDQMTDLSKDLRNWLKENVSLLRLEEEVAQQSDDGTRKFLWKLDDRKTIESVVIPAALTQSELAPGEEGYDQDNSFFDQLPEGQRFSGVPTENDLRSGGWKRLTACISSQVGCAMSCKFCLTGIQGLDRHLKVEEIVTQILELRTRAPITNIVFMGMGEPLHNLENVTKACQILLDQDGLNFSKRKVTVSTSGIVPAIEELGRRVDVSLAISLNSSTDEQRSAIMPVNKKWNIATLMEACKKFPLGPHRKITFEYVMLKGFNDSVEDAARVYQWVKGIPSKVNLIPFNEHPGSEFKRPADADVKAFQRYLMDRGVTTTVRISRGRDILAACGQLRSLFGTAKGTDRHKDESYRPAENSI